MSSIPVDGATVLLPLLGDGHGRRLLLLDALLGPRDGVPEVVAEVAIALSRRAWAVCCRTPEQAAIASARTRAEAAGAVVDWRSGGVAALGGEGGEVVAAVVSIGDPGLSDPRVVSALASVLVEGGALVALLPPGATVATLDGFVGVGVSRLPGAVVASACRG